MRELILRVSGRGSARWLSVFLVVLGALSLYAQVSPQLYGGLKWRMIGPFRGGRVVAVAGIPGNPATFYFGSVDGGIWKTADAGLVWTPIFDGQPVGSIGALAVAPSSPNVIYAGTGESDIRTDLASGNGVYKSTDGGTTWKNVGLANTRQISRVIVDPQSPDVVYVAALGHAYAPNPDRGVYKSTDGGTNWTKVLDAGAETGIADLSLASGQPNMLFAATWHTYRPPWSSYGTIEEPGSGIFRSLDGGQTWSRLSGGGLPAGDWNRPSVAVSADGKRVYALIDCKNHAGLYRSDDGGNTWSLQNADRRLTSRSWYFSNIAIDPQNPDVVYVPSVALYRSVDGGKTIEIVRGAPGGDDYHQLWIDPKDSSRMVLGTDQGTTISLDCGKTWSSWYNQPTAQIYHLAADNKFPYAVYGTQQDSGAVAVLSRTDHGQITARDWFPAGASESGYIVPDPSDPNVLFLSGTYGDVARFDLRTSFSQDVTPWPVRNFAADIAAQRYRAPWTPVLVFSPADRKSLYLGTQYVMKTLDGGLYWTQISPDLTGAVKAPGEKKPPELPTVENAKQRGYGVVFTIAPSSLNPGLIWAGSDTGLIHLTRDGGKNWADVTPKGLSGWSKISLIDASHFDPAEAYAAVDRHELDDQKPYLYRTRDYGVTWQLITEGIQEPAFLNAVREDPRTRGLLFAGTEFGIYVSFDDGDQWQSVQLNLPVTSVRDLVFHGDDLVVATHGRSLWILDDIMPLRQVKQAAKAADGWLYRPSAAVRVDNDMFQGTPIPPEEPAASNPPNGAVLDYYLAGPASQLTIEIFDSKGELVRSFSSDDPKDQKRLPMAVADRWLAKPESLEKTPGMHRFVWSLAWGGPGGKGADGGAEYASRAPRVVPGNYEVRLTVDKTIFSQPLQVIMDPRSSATAQELDQQQRMGRQIYSEMIAARQAVAGINAVQKQLADRLSGIGEEHHDLKAAVSQLQFRLGAILAGGAESPDQAIGLENAAAELASALRVVESGDRTVPAQAVAVYQESSSAAQARMAEWQQLEAGAVVQLNEQLRRANFSPLTLSEIENGAEQSVSD